MTWEGLSPPYATIVADPPWPIDWNPTGTGGRRRNHTRPGYSFMPLGEIMALPVADLAMPDAYLLLWITPKFNRHGIGVQVAQAWGFRDVGEIVWAKPNFGFGTFPRPSHETALVCVRGNPRPIGPHNIGSVHRWPQTYGKGNSGKQHSAKPAAFFDLIERACPGPYVELFARQPRLGWDSWGWGYEQGATA